MLLPRGTQKGEAGTRGGYTSAYGPDWTQSKFKFPTVQRNTNSFARNRRAVPCGGVLLDFYFGARIFELLLNGGGFVFVDAFLDRFRCAIDEVLGFLEAQARHFTHGFNDVDLVGSHFGEHDGKLGFLLSRSGAGCGASASHHYGCGGSSRN